MAGAFADSKGRYGYRRIKAVLKTGVSEKVVRRIMAEEGLSAHVPKRRRYSSYEGETTPAPANLVDRDFTAERPNEKWLTDISEIKARDGKVYLSPPVDCFDGKIVAYTAGFSPVFRQVGVSCWGWCRFVGLVVDSITTNHATRPSSRRRSMMLMPNSVLIRLSRYQTM